MCIRDRSRPAENESPSARTMTTRTDGSSPPPTSARADHRLGTWGLRRSAASRAIVRRGPDCSTRSIGWGRDCRGLDCPGFATRATLGERDEVQIVRTPVVLDTIGQNQDPFGLERGNRALIVADQDNGTLVGAQGAENLLARGWVE